MPYGGNDWLALTQEPTLEPEIPICDPHHHFWDFRSERIPYQRYLLHELAADVNCGHNVRSTVFIEARSMYRPDGPLELRPVGEVEFVHGLAAAAATGLYGPCRAASAIIGHADLKLGDRVEPVLQALQAASPNRFRGIRHTVTWDPHPEIENREKEGALATADYRAGAGVLAHGPVAGYWGVFSPIAGVGHLRQGLTRSDDHPEPPWRADAGWPLRQQGRRGLRNGGAASRPWRSARTSILSWAASACPGWASTGILAPGRSAPKSWPRRSLRS